jgi:putative ABC transport system permease protein
MFTPETLETALHRFRTHPVQMGLTLLGLVVGTAAIILIVALGLTGRTFVMAQIEGVGSHLVWASYEGTVTSGV